MSAFPPYISIPPAAVPILSPTASSASSFCERPKTTTRTTLPLPTSSVPPPITRKFSIPTNASLSTNVSDLLLGSLLPPNLPKLPQGIGKDAGPSGPRELSTQREALSLPLLSNNFRRFVTKVCGLFRVDERQEC